MRSLSSTFLSLCRRAVRPVLPAAVLFLSWPSLVFSQSNEVSLEVISGQEIAISVAASPGSEESSLLHPGTFRSLPGSRLRRTLAQGTIGVVGAPGASNDLRGDRVVPNTAAIHRQCKRLLRENPDLNLTCEPNHVVRVETIPDDQHFPLLWGMSRIDAPLAWERSTGDRSVMVAVVDTGVEYSHPDLQRNIAVNGDEIAGNGIDDDQNGYTDDYLGYDFYNGDADPVDDHFHGTHCAGTIGAEGNNSVGVTGAAWAVSILPVKVIGSQGYGTIAAVAAGIRYGVQRGAKVISLSLSHGASSAVENALTEARIADIVVVAAAGNEGSNNDLYPVYPANSASPNVISVAASDPDDLLTYWSNFGALTVDVAAPGLQIYSTGLNGGYRFASGTSMATPHVAGIVAVIRAAAPTLTFAEIKTILFDTVDRRTELENRVVSQGRVNFNRALAAALGEELDPPTATPTPTPTFTFTPTPTPSPTPLLTPTPIPSAVPSPIAAPVETPALTPSPTPHPWPRKVTIKARSVRDRTLIQGVILNRNRNPVRRAQVFAICRQKLQRVGRTDDEGRFTFALPKAKRRRICFVRDESGVASRKILTF